MHRHKKTDPTNPAGRWVFPYLLIMIVSGVAIVGYTQHDRYGPAILCFIPLLIGAKLFLWVERLIREDVEFQKRNEYRRSVRPTNLSDVDQRLSRDICRATRHSRSRISRNHK